MKRSKSNVGLTGMKWNKIVAVPLLQHTSGTIRTRVIVVSRGIRAIGPKSSCGKPLFGDVRQVSVLVSKADRRLRHEGAHNVDSNSMQDARRDRGRVNLRRWTRKRLERESGDLESVPDDCASTVLLWQSEGLPDDFYVDLGFCSEDHLACFF